MADDNSERIHPSQPGDGGENNKSKPKGHISPEVWTLEDSFPEVEYLFSSSREISASDSDVIVTLDTNALLLPFRVGLQDLSEIERAYQKLIADGRLYIPARVVKEYTKNRDGRLAELLKALTDKSSSTNASQVEVPPLLNDLDETRAVLEAGNKLKSARSEYIRSVSSLLDVIKKWKGNDPVTRMYENLFKNDVIFKINYDREEIERKWQIRILQNIPPGYKDGSKPDKGIGDYLIWLTILEIGHLHKKDLIFVTGEEKSDWFVRTGGEAIYPRPELVDEYRRASSGKTLYLSRLADVLSSLKTPVSIVNEVRQAEDAANNEIQLTRTLTLDLTKHLSLSQLADLGARTNKKVVRFDYSTNNGNIVLEDNGRSFLVRFSKASGESIHVYNTLSTQQLARAKSVRPGDTISFNDYDHSSSYYTCRIGDLFLIRNAKRETLVGRIGSILDDSRGADRDEVLFSYEIFDDDSGIVA